MAEHVSQEEIYDAFLDDGALAALPGRLAASVGARSCLIQWIVEDGTSAILSQSGYFPDAMLAEYGERWNSIDPWLEASHQWQAPNAAMNLEDLSRSAPSAGRTSTMISCGGMVTIPAAASAFA
jgi:hypothetical protein